MLAVSGLSKAFGGRTLFDEVSFQLTPGSRDGLVGANGSGNITLLRRRLSSAIGGRSALSSHTKAKARVTVRTLRCRMHMRVESRPRDLVRGLVSFG